jgi:hypothetical protein
MYAPGKRVKHKRTGSPNGIDPVLDTYEFKRNVRMGQVNRVVVTYTPGRGYTTIVHIEGKTPMGRDYPDGQWGQARGDLDEALREHQCDLFTIKDPGQP